MAVFRVGQLAVVRTILLVLYVSEEGGIIVDRITTKNSIKFFVPGIPATQGSKKAFFNKKIGRAIVVEDCKRNKDWRAMVSHMAAETWGNHAPIAGAVALKLYFYLPRPKDHFNKKGELKATAKIEHIKKPDLVKLARAVEDAMKGIIYYDDSQIVCEYISKLYTMSDAISTDDNYSKIGVAVEVEEI
jgi:crossover junction endodeoxyribonuclease RusA